MKLTKVFLENVLDMMENGLYRKANSFWFERNAIDISERSLYYERVCRTYKKTSVDLF